MKLNFLIKLKENNYKSQKGSSNYVEIKKVERFSEDLKFIPELSSLTFVTTEKELPLVYDEKNYSIKILDNTSLILNCELKKLNEDLEFEYRCQGIDVSKVDEYLCHTIEIFPMYVTLDIEGYDMYTNDYEITLKDVILDSGEVIKESVIDYYNRCN